MALLTEGAADRLVDTCRDTAGEQLRSVTYFTANDFDQLYLRDDLERGADLSSFIGLEWRESGITEGAYQGTELGEIEYTIRAFENGFLLRVETDHDGVFVTTDRLAMGNFEELALALEETLESFHGD